MQVDSKQFQVLGNNCPLGNFDIPPRHSLNLVHLFSFLPGTFPSHYSQTRCVLLAFPLCCSWQLALSMRPPGASTLVVSPSAARKVARLLRRGEFGDLANTSTTCAIADHPKSSFGPKSPLKTPVALGAQDTLTVSLTAKDNGKAKRPHQAFVLLKDEDTGLEAPFPLSVRDTGKGNVKIVRAATCDSRAAFCIGDWT